MLRPIALFLLCIQIGVALLVAYLWDGASATSRLFYALSLTAVFYSLPSLLIDCLFPHHLVVVIHSDPKLHHAAVRLVDFIFCGVVVMTLLANAAVGNAGTLTNYLFPFMTGWLASTGIDLHRIVKRLR